MFLLVVLAGCQDSGVSPLRADETGAAPVHEVRVPRTSFVVGAGTDYPATWSGGIVDRSRTCFVETDEGTDYSGCCPEGFDAVGFQALEDSAGHPDEAVVCLEQPSGRGRAAVAIGLGSGDIQPHGRWQGGVFLSGSCALDILVDNLPANAAWGRNPPEDYRDCCPTGFTAVGFTHAYTADEITCLENLE